jgi:acetolactate synthase-1/2/3 large subunit
MVRDLQDDARTAPVMDNNGAYSLLGSLVASGVELCFANPGTSEIQWVSALDRVAAMRAILCLAEGVVTGAADGYGRMAGRPATTLLHLGPGLANGLANLHNARRAGTPIVNIVGDHATHHLKYDAPLASDIAGFARPVSAWIHVARSAQTVGADGARAVQAARTAPGQVATLILPADVAWSPAEEIAAPLPTLAPAAVPCSIIDRAAGALRTHRRTALLLRGAVLQPPGLAAAGRIAQATGCRLLVDTFAPRLARGAGRVIVERIPYFAETMVEFLADLECLLLVGAKPPVAFFAYPGKPSWCLPAHCEIVALSEEHEDGTGALESLAEMLGAPATPRVAPWAPPELPSGKLNAYTIGQVIAHLMPEGAILADDGATSSGGTMEASVNARPHDHLALTGGAIGFGMPLAIGAAVACPARKVITLVGDGSAAYSPQALWTQARERLDITTIVFSNRAYKILQVEMGRFGATAGPAATRLLELGDPVIDWISIAEGFGVEASGAATVKDFIAQFRDAMERGGPRLIAARL